MPQPNQIRTGENDINNNESRVHDTAADFQASASSGTVNNPACSNNNNNISAINPQYLTIIQEPYPPLNHSPELFEINQMYSHDMGHISSVIDCINMNETNELQEDLVKKESFMNENNFGSSSNFHRKMHK
jgi:hypothetical protein